MCPLKSFWRHLLELRISNRHGRAREERETVWPAQIQDSSSREPWTRGGAGAGMGRGGGRGLGVWRSRAVSFDSAITVNY